MRQFEACAQALQESGHDKVAMPLDTYTCHGTSRVRDCSRCSSRRSAMPALMPLTCGKTSRACVPRILLLPQALHKAPHSCIHGAHHAKADGRTPASCTAGCQTSRPPVCHQCAACTHEPGLQPHRGSDFFSDPGSQVQAVSWSSTSVCAVLVGKAWPRRDTAEAG